MVHSLYQSLNNLETIYADRIGIRYYDEAKGGVVEVPFRQYAADLRRFVAFLRSRTPNPLGQRVAILARNSYHYVMCMYGAVLAGAVAVPLNTGKNWDEIRYELDLVEPVCVLHDGEYLSREPALGQAYGDRDRMPNITNNPSVMPQVMKLFFVVLVMALPPYTFSRIFLPRIPVGRTTRTMISTRNTIASDS